MQRLGSKEDAEQKLASQVADRTRRDAAKYTPVAMNPPAPPGRIGQTSLALAFHPRAS